MGMDRWNTNRDTAPDSHDEAELWFVRMLERDCPAGQRAAFERWLAEDPAHAAAYRELEQLWKQSAEAVKDPVLAAAARQAMQREPEQRTSRRWMFPALAAGFAAVAIAVLVPRWLSTPADPVGVTYATATGQQQTIKLTDGSSILLDTDSQVVVRYSERTRRVDLLRGQAQFSVQGNHAWPFVVHAGAGTVTAVGTQFQVRLEDQITDVALIKGKLAIVADALDGTVQDASLVGGQSLAYDDDGHITPVRPIDSEQTQGWTQGKLFVHDWRLPELLSEMNRYSDTKLQVADPSLQDIHISGVFRTNDQHTLLLSLQQGWPIHAKRVSATQIELLRNQ